MKASLKVGVDRSTTWNVVITDVYMILSLAGKWEKIGGIDTYVATPSGDYPKNKVILFLPDVFGPQLINARVRSLFVFFFLGV